MPNVKKFTRQHGDHGDEDLLHRLHGGPSLGTGLVSGRIVARGVQNAEKNSKIMKKCK